MKNIIILTWYEILTYTYVKPRSNGFRTKKTPRLTPLGSPEGARGLCPLGTLAHTLWQRDPTEPDSTAASAWGSGAFPSLGLPIYGTSGPGPWLLPGY
jgi:hypothetical protein